MRGGVPDAIAHQTDFAAFLLQLFDESGFLLGGPIGKMPVGADAGGHLFGGFFGFAGEEPDFQAARAQAHDHGLAILTQHALEDDHAGE